jgi:hypothetical protein
MRPRFLLYHLQALFGEQLPPSIRHPSNLKTLLTTNSESHCEVLRCYKESFRFTAHYVDSRDQSTTTEFQSVIFNAEIDTLYIEDPGIAQLLSRSSAPGVSTLRNLTLDLLDRNTSMDRRFKIVAGLLSRFKSMDHLCLRVGYWAPESTAEEFAVGVERVIRERSIGLVDGVFDAFHCYGGITRLVCWRRGGGERGGKEDGLGGVIMI